MASPAGRLSKFCLSMRQNCEKSLKSVSKSGAGVIGFERAPNHRKERVEVRQKTHRARTGLMNWTRNPTGKLCSKGKTSDRRADLCRLILITFFVPERTLFRRVRSLLGNSFRRGFL